MNTNPHSRENLIGRVLKLSDSQLPRLADYLSLLETNGCEAERNREQFISPQSKLQSQSSAPAWPHAPIHRISELGTYIVTAATLYKRPMFRGKERLNLLQSKLLELAQEHGWQMEAWAVFPNHYHFVAHSLAGSDKLKNFLSHLHTATATELNRFDEQTKRRVWFNYWETQLTYPESYLARLNYVHQNAVRHGLVSVSNQYRWCSAAWFERTATPAQVKTIYAFKTDTVKIHDDYEVGVEDLA